MAIDAAACELSPKQEPNTSPGFDGKIQYSGVSPLFWMIPEQLKTQIIVQKAAETIKLTSQSDFDLFVRGSHQGGKT